MRRALAIAGVLGLAALVMAARPGNEFQLIQQLNGQPVRWLLPDAGRSGIFSQYDAGTANNFGCVRITPAKTATQLPILPDGGLSPAEDGGPPSPVYQTINANVLMLLPLTPVNVCLRPSVLSGVWDGGCNTLPTDENYGVPLAVGVPQYITPDSAATTLCAVTDAGYLAMPVWTVQ